MTASRGGARGLARGGATGYSSGGPWAKGCGSSDMSTGWKSGRMRRPWRQTARSAGRPPGARRRRSRRCRSRRAGHNVDLLADAAGAVGQDGAPAMPVIGRRRGGPCAKLRQMPGDARAVGIVRVVGGDHETRRAAAGSAVGRPSPRPRMKSAPPRSASTMLKSRHSPASICVTASGRGLQPLGGAAPAAGARRGCACPAPAPASRRGSGSRRRRRRGSSPSTCRPRCGRGRR